MDKIKLGGLITPISLNDSYPVIDPIFGIDGLRNVSSLSDMYNIPMEKRRSGMVVGVSDNLNNTVVYYKLKPEGNGLTWSVGTSSDWDGFLTSGTGSIPTRYNIVNETVEVPTNTLYLIYGDLTIGTGGSLINGGKTVILNGNLYTHSTGQFINTSGLFSTVSLAYQQKVVKTFSSTPGIGITISHGLNTTDFTYTIRDGYNFVNANVEISSSNPTSDVIVTCATQISVATITIMG
jgi:hypothetical protein